MDKSNSNTAVIWILGILILSITVYLMIHYCKKHFFDDSVQSEPDAEPAVFFCEG